MSVAGSQRQTFLRLARELRPHWRRDPLLPARLQAALARDKRFGSRDRRLYRELLYTATRYLPWIEPPLDTDETLAAKIVAWLAADTRDTAAYRRELCADWPAPGSLAARAAFLRAEVAALFPEWIREECPALLAPAELEAQFARAPLWLRVAPEQAERVAAEFAQQGWRYQPSSILPGAWRLLEEVDVTKSAAYAAGAVEVQDLGSQCVLASAGVRPGGRWLDACAGAGGKTLQLARLLGPTGQVVAHDIRRSALEELASRANRAGSRVTHDGGRLSAPSPASSTPPSLSAPIAILAPGSLDPKGALAVSGRVDTSYDGVLVDAPCSGSGTWRRSPHLKWLTTRATLAARAEEQVRLLGQFSGLVRPGGMLVYATCSLARSENEGVIERFLAAHASFRCATPPQTFGFSAAPLGLTMLPSRHDTDGFFVSLLLRSSA